MYLIFLFNPLFIMINFFFCSDIILRIIKLFSERKFDKYNFSENLYQNIQKYIRYIVQKTVKYMKINRKIKMTISDIKNANLENSEIKFIHDNQTVVKIFKKKFDIIPELKKNEHFIDYISKNFNSDNQSFFILKKWFLFDFNKNFNLDNEKLDLFFNSNFKQYVKLENLAFSFLLNKEFIFYKYIQNKLEKGNYIEKDFCLENLSKYKKINIIIPHLILYSNGCLCRCNNSLFRLRLVIK
nr:transcriotion associated factor [Cryptomonas curvata]